MSSSIFFDPTQPKVSAGQVYIRSPHNPKEFLYLEIQGEIISTLTAEQLNLQPGDEDRKRHLWGQALGEYEEKPDGECTLRVGNLLIVGKKEKLKKPLVVLQRVDHQQEQAVKPQQLLYEIRDFEQVTEKGSILSTTTNTTTIRAKMSDADDDSNNKQIVNNNETFGESDQYEMMGDSLLVNIEGHGDNKPQKQQQQQMGLLAAENTKCNTTPIEPTKHMVCRGVVLYKAKFDKRPIPLVQNEASK